MVETRIEPLSYMLLNGLIELSFEAWNETDFKNEHPEIPYNPDWEAYQRKETENRLRFFALREGPQLIGYASIVIDTDIHREGTLIASFRDIFISHDKRGHAASFVKYIEKVLSSLGVKRVYAAERYAAKNECGKFYEAMGFVPQETLYGKTLH